MTEKLLKLLWLLHCLEQNNHHDLLSPALCSIRLLDEHAQSKAELIKKTPSVLEYIWVFQNLHIGYWLDLEKVLPFQLMCNFLILMHKWEILVSSLAGIPAMLP